MTIPSFIYVMSIATTPARLWEALTDANIMRDYWLNPAADGPAHVNVSDWTVGSGWEHQRLDEARTVDLVGEVIECTPPSRLVLSWARPEDKADGSRHSTVSFDIAEQAEGLVRLTVTHDGLAGDPQMLAGISSGWPTILSNLKTLLETGRPLPRKTSTVPATERSAAPRHFSGGCACGAIRYHTDAAPLMMGDCQCRQCQRESGTGHASALIFPRQDVELEGTTSEWTAVGDGGTTKSKAFCPVCGSPVYMTLAEMPEVIVIRAGSLDDPALYQPQLVTWTAAGHAWDRIDRALPSFEGMPPR